MKRSLVTLVLMTVIFGASASAQIVFDEYPSALGFYGDTSGIYGLTYQRWMGRVGFQTALTVSTDTYVAGSFNAAAIVEGTYRIYAEDFANWLSGALYFAGLAGGGLSRGADTVEGSSVLGDLQTTIHGGLGIGIEAVLFRHFALDLQFLYRAKYQETLDVNLGVGFSAAYRF